MSSPLPEHHEDHPITITRNSRIGLLLFSIYFILYLGFLILNITSPALLAGSKITIPWIESDGGAPTGGPNLAIVYGIGLIFAAFLLALWYMRLTRSQNSEYKSQK